MGGKYWGIEFHLIVIEENNKVDSNCTNIVWRFKNKFITKLSVQKKRI